MVWVRLTTVSSPISIRTAGDWSLRNLSTGWLVYLYPSANFTPNASTIHKHVHDCRRALNALKRSLWPRVFFYLVQATGQAPVMFPVPFGLTGKHVVRERIVIPIIKFALQSCKLSSFLSNVV